MSFWCVFRVRLSAAISALGVRLGPRDYRQWIHRAMELGVQSSERSDGAIYRVTAQHDDGPAATFDFPTRAEAQAFMSGFDFAMTGNPDVAKASPAAPRKFFYTDLIPDTDSN